MKKLRFFARNGIRIVSLFQEYAFNTNYFNYLNGQSDAVRAINAAKNLKQPNNTPIFFAAETKLKPNYAFYVHDYLRGVVSKLSDPTVNTKNYKLGVYAPQDTCKRIKEDWFHDAYTMFCKPYGTNFSGWTIMQDNNPEGYTGSLQGLVDFNITRTSVYGGWLYHDYPNTWNNYGNAANHRKKCLYCDKYIYQPHTPDSTGNRCTVCGYIGTILNSDDRTEEEYE